MNLDFVKSTTNFILVKLESKAAYVAKQLMKKGVIVRDMSFWGLGKYIRVTIGTGVENKRFIKTLEKIL